MRETITTRTRLTALLRRLKRKGGQLTIFPLDDGRSVVALDPVPISFKLAVARRLKIDPAIFIEPKARRTKKRKRTLPRAD